MSGTSHSPSWTHSLIAVVAVLLLTQSTCHMGLLVLTTIAVVLAHQADCKIFHGRLGRTPTPEQASYRHQPAPLLNKADLPPRFNWCEADHHGPNLCTSSWNQHNPMYCGSCFVHGTLSMVQDRLKVAKKGQGPDAMLGRQSFLNCAAFEGYGDGCNGGDVFDVLGYMTKHGLPDESCFHYQATDHTNLTGDWRNLKHCPADAFCRNCMPLNDTDPGTCWAVEKPIIYKLARYGKIDPPGEHGMMSEIFQRGPITCSIATPDSFVYGYHSGVWHDALNSSDVDHDVEVVGWGEEDGDKFWHIRNSWGSYFGELGFFKLARGENTFKIEEPDCWYAEPTFDVEESVRRGDYEGSMYGLRERKQGTSSA